MNIKELALRDEDISEIALSTYGPLPVECFDISETRRYFARAIEQAVHVKYAARDAEAVPVEIDWPDYHDQAMGCGLEDRNITNRYEAMRHGWECAIEQIASRIPDQLFTHPAPVVRSGMTVLDISDDDALRYIQRVLESEAPEQDRNAARDLVVEIRTRVRKHADDVSKIEAERDQLRAALVEAVDALDRLSKLGNGDARGNSVGNDIAFEALTRSKEVLK